MTAWLFDAQNLSRQGKAFVMVTVARTLGSAPREAGTRMLVTREEALGTIGGGHLEYQAASMAREMLTNGPGFLWHRFALGPSLGQCCGGVVELLFEHEHADRLGWIDVLVDQLRGGASAVLAVVAEGERRCRMVLAPGMTWNDGELDAAAQGLARRALCAQGVHIAAASQSSRPSRVALAQCVRPPELEVVLFGAGHVGRALIGVLGMLPCHVTWVDSREDEFCSDPPANVTVECTADPTDEVASAAIGACFLVLTHSHALDFELSRRILARGDFRFFGLIGSLTKRRGFERRLRDRGVPESMLERMRCPIGVEGIAGKEPGVIAVAVAAQLLRLREGCGAPASHDYRRAHRQVAEEVH
ncbi:xanthine dehydrogenase accessory protein XdhC [Variovorax sp. Sphag1AA]|uniref:xanthine dehydrogenase accessory protein XdhC n=1 Tax=Variovorax sp. Sphag1AA TaxID=2587027 RepID=UPI001614C88E|nr:xanthine dehydrogenase accessory protein XdhC [Variovorax sp. Sphag1AA]MBB3182028.1 xanthine dehydrogenase accessory factor [Variovorax sp. Sphag1AA]